MSASFRSMPLLGGAELGTEQTAAEIGKPRDVTTRVEPMLCGQTGRTRAQQIEPLQHFAGRERRLVGARHQRHVRAHHIADDPSQVRVVGAAEQQRVDARSLDGSKQSLSEDDDLVPGGLAPLDELDEAGTSSRGQLDIGARCRNRAFVGPGTDRTDSADHGNAA